MARRDALAAFEDPRWTSWPTRAVAASAGVYLLTYVLIALTRMGYPYELEWLEGLALEHVQRLREGKPLYVAPSLDWIAFNYTPLYFHVSSWVSRLVDGFTGLRLVSFVSSLGVFTLLAMMVRRETGSALAAFLAAGLFAATYRLSGAWFDVARIDSLFLVLLLGALYAVRSPARPLASAALAGVLFGLAFLTKQTTAVVVLPVIAYLAWQERRRFLALVLGIVVVGGGGALLLNTQSAGWFAFYVFGVASSHPLQPDLAARFWVDDLNGPLLVSVLLGVFYFMVHRGRGAPRAFFLMVTIGLVGSSAIQRLYPVCYENVLMTAYAGVALLFGLGWHEARLAIARAPADSRALLAVFLPVAALLQFSLLTYDPVRQVPTEQDRLAGDRLVEALAKIKGDVLIPGHSYLARRAGKPPHFHEMTFMDVVNGRDAGVSRRLLESFRSAVSQRRYAGIVLETRDWLGEEVLRSYEVRYEAFDDDELFWPVTGMRTRPEVVALPAEAVDSG